MICEHCHEEIPDGSRFCPLCGARLSQDTASIGRNATLTGQTLAGKYVIEKRIGSGAMGNIYKATHLDLGKPMVVKVLHEHLVSDDSQVKRFRREAKAASLLNHPNVVQVYDFGHTSSGLAYIVMEFIEGDDIRKILFNEGKISQQRTIDISAQVFSALAEAHAAGIIHRDIKPENIMVSMAITGEDVVKVLDFGIAKLQDMAAGGSLAFKTATGTVFGTPEYMSPEQITGKDLDHRTDLYSYGITMFEMLTGNLPFEGEGLLEIATQQLRKPMPSIREQCPEVSEELEQFVAKLLAKSPDDRFHSAVEAREHLLTLKENLKTHATSVPAGSAHASPQQKTESGADTSEAEVAEDGSTMMISDPDFVKEIQKKMEQAKVEKRQQIFSPQDTDTVVSKKKNDSGSSKNLLYLWVGVGLLSLAIIGVLAYILMS